MPAEETADVVEAKDKGKGSALGTGAVQPAAPAAAKEPKGAKEQRFRVLRDTEVPRGASTFKLAAGKIVSTRSYDVGELRKYGVPLEEIK